MHFKILTIAAMAIVSLAAVPAASAATATGLTITPSTVTMTADQQHAFIVTTTNNDGTTTNVTAATTFSPSDPIGSMSGATYSAGKVGTWTIAAFYQSFSASATVNVLAGDLAEIVINPNSDPEYTTIGKTQKFTADGFDQDKNGVKGSTMVWSVIGEIGTISRGGVFTPTTIGTGKVQAQSGTITGQIPVVVSAAPVTNANDNTNTSPVNTNAGSTNTNAANVNSAPPVENSNVNVPIITIAEDTSDNNLQCTTLNSWLWILLLVATLAAVFFLYWIVPATKFWPVVVALFSAGILTFIQRKYGCGGQDWWAWVMIIGTVAISLMAVRQSTPKKTLP